MKLPPLPWYLVLYAAAICAAFAGLYRYCSLPGWIVAFAALSAVVLAVVALNMRDSRTLESNYEYGRCNGRLARRHKASGVVEFILWPVGTRHGEFVYKENFWCAFDSSWWPTFKSGREGQPSEEAVASQHT